MIYLFVVQFPTGDYLYIHPDMVEFPGLLSQATMFETHELAQKYCRGKSMIRKLEIRFVD